MTAVVRFERIDDVALIVIDNPPINAGSSEVRLELMAAVNALRDSPELVAGVICGEGDTFMAGSDIREFGLPLAEPQLPSVIQAIERCGKPVVAALNGPALGGGFELALGCDARIALPSAIVGLPEVTLGILPGAGGTQRLPRLVGIPKAIELICGGSRIKAEQAKTLGMVDLTVERDLLAAAVAYAKDLGCHKNLVRDRKVPASPADFVEQATVEALRKGKSRPAVRAAIEAVTMSAELPIDEALVREREAFQKLRATPEAAALRYQFFAERDATKHNFLKNVGSSPVTRVGVIGAGTMGSGIALSLLDAGIEVLLVEQDQTALKRGLDRITDHYQNRVKAGKTTAEAVSRCLSRLTCSIDWSDLEDADLIIEAVFEDLEVKKSVFRRIDSIAKVGAVLASNTSYLDLDLIADSTKRPQDVIGLHFFSPANVMRLVEVVRGAASSPRALCTGLDVAKRIRKLPVLARNAFGFIGNRIYAAYRRQCEFLIEEGAYPEEVDRALEDFGFAMGPFAVADMSGLDIAWRMRQSLASQRDPTSRYVNIPDRLCEEGRLGRKVGAGYYGYAENGGKRTPAPEVRAIIERERQAKGVVPRVITVEEIQRRALMAMANEAALLLEEGVAERASDIDLVLVNGYGFPRWEGGIFFWARSRDKRIIERDLEETARLSGPGFVCCDLDRLLSN